jgi:hypothetical protein
MFLPLGGALGARLILVDSGSGRNVRAIGLEGGSIIPI